MVFVFYHRLAFGAFKGRDICGGACGEASYDERRSSSLSGRTMWIFATNYGAFQTQSGLICDCFEDYCEHRVISSAIVVSGICSKPNPNLAAKYSRNIRLCASFTFSRSQTTPRV